MTRDNSKWLTRAVLAMTGLLLVVSALACGTGTRAPDLSALYDRAASYHAPDRNPIIVVPGIMGSRLVDDDGMVVWGAFDEEYADPDDPAGARRIALPMEKGKSLRILTDGVHSNGVLDRLRVRILGLPIQLEAYVQILQVLGVGGYQDAELADEIDYGDDHFTCFQFPYDWRRDNVENARYLVHFIEDRRRFVQEQIEARWGVEDADVKFDVVAHSMGGVLLRYALRYGGAELPENGLPELTWAGTEHVDTAILVGPPNSGSLAALEVLVDGKHLPVVEHYPPALVSTFVAPYQLLPRTRHRAVVDGDGDVVDLFDAGEWERHRWGLFDDDGDRTLRTLLPDLGPGERKAVVRDHLEKSLARARRFQAALDLPADPPESLDLHLFAGDSRKTSRRMRVEDDGDLTVIERDWGDGQVLRSSALGDERMDGEWSPIVRTAIRWHTVRFLFADHLGLTKSPAFTDNLLYLLLEAPG